MDQPIKLEVTDMQTPPAPPQHDSPPQLPLGGLQQSPNGALPVQLAPPPPPSQSLVHSGPGSPPASYHSSVGVYGHPVPTEMIRGSISTLSTSSTRFPVKLWEIVTTDQTGSICWNPEGNGFIVDHERFDLYYLKAGTFKTSKITSFIRQLNLYGFRKAKKNHLSPETWETYMSGSYDRKQQRSKKSKAGVLREYRHTHFLRDKPDFLSCVRRVSDSGRKAGGDSKAVRKPKPHYRRGNMQSMGFSVGPGCHPGAPGYASMLMAPPGFPDYDWFQAGSSGAANVSELFGMTSHSVPHNMSQMGNFYGNSYAGDPNSFWHQLPGYSAWFNGTAAQQFASVADAVAVANATSEQANDNNSAEAPAVLPGFAELHPTVSGQLSIPPTDGAYVSPGTSFATDKLRYGPRMGEYVVSYWDQGASGSSPSDPPTDLSGCTDGHAITTAITSEEHSADGGAKEDALKRGVGGSPGTLRSLESRKAIGEIPVESSRSATYFSL